MVRYNTNSSQIFSLWGLLSLLIFCNTSLASTDSNIDQLQIQLIDLRAIVDAKSEALSLLRQEAKQKRKFLISQFSELESSIEDRNRVIKKISNKLKSNRDFLSKLNQSEPLENELISAIKALSDYVKTSLPFKRDGRLAALNEIQTQLTSKAVSAPRLANKLWAFVEDEIMLTKGNGIYRQTIEIDNEEKLVDVARIGMMMLYFRDGMGDVGMAKKDKNGWKFINLSDEEKEYQVHFLFDSFQKQIRFGEFRLPNGLSANVSKRGL